MKVVWASCLALVGVCLLVAPCRAEASDRAAGASPPECVQKLIVVTIWPQGDPPQAVEASYHEELRQLLADLGVCFAFADLHEATTRSFSGRIVVLRMLEQEEARDARETLGEVPRAALAWTHASGSNVTPFGAVDLCALRGFLGMEHPDSESAEATQRQGAAIARVAAHEIFHMLTRSKTHSDHGLMKPGLSRSELLAEKAPRWTRDNCTAARALLHPGAVQELAAVSGEQSTGEDRK